MELRIHVPTKHNFVISKYTPNCSSLDLKHVFAAVSFALWCCHCRTFCASPIGEGDV